MSWLKRGYHQSRLNIRGMDAQDAVNKSGEQTDIDCAQCGAVMRIRVRQRDSVPFLGCSDYPECRHLVHAWGRKGEKCPGDGEEDEGDEDQREDVWSWNR